MVARRLYDLIYRRGAPWEIGPRSELIQLVESGRVLPAEYPAAVDLGCGTGANSLFLAAHGFDVVGVDFSPVAISKAWRHARFAPGRVRFVQGDLTAESIPTAEGPFDLLIDYGTLDDLGGSGRRSMAATIRRLSRPGSLLLLWCFYGARADLPFFSFQGPSKVYPGLRPGEERVLFADSFEIERLPGADGMTACFLMTRI